MCAELKFERNEELKAIIRCQRNIKDYKETSDVLKSFSISSDKSIWSDEVINEYILTVTDRNIYLEGIYRKHLGELPQVLNVSKIPLESIEDFNVDSEEGLEHITIRCNEKQSFKLVHKNKHNSDEATQIKELFFNNDEIFY